jgi:hypothetical protein
MLAQVALLYRLLQYQRAADALQAPSGVLYTSKQQATTAVSKGRQRSAMNILSPVAVGAALLWTLHVRRVLEALQSPGC